VDIRQDATGYGTHVRIEHVEGNTKYLTIYGHMMKSSVSVGSALNAGDVIGKSDNTGFSTGPHLHFELREGTQPIDPAPLLVKTVAELEAGGVQPELPEEVEVEPAGFPKLPKARILIAALNIRSGPGAQNRIAGTLMLGDEVEVLRKVIQGNDIWLQIGHEQFIAMRHEGNNLARWV
jgi:hypothetical protein